ARGGAASRGGREGWRAGPGHASPGRAVKRSSTAPVEGLGDTARLTSGSHDGTSLVPGARNQGTVVESVVKKSISSFVTCSRPGSVGCVPSVLKSSHGQVRPSLRGVSPSAQRYGPHASHGAFPFA